MKARLIASKNLFLLVWNISRRDCRLYVFALAQLFCSFLFAAVIIILLSLWQPDIWDKLFTYLAAPDLVTFPLLTLVVFAIFGLVLFIISHLFDAFALALALGTIRNSPKSFTHTYQYFAIRFWPLLQFSTLSSTIGVALSALENNASWLGSLGARLGHGSWNLASTFALPILLDGTTDNPFAATKLSIKALTASFGENIIVRGANTFVLGLLITIILLVGIFGTSLAFLYTNMVIVVLMASISILMFCALLILSLVVKTVTTALLYEYVVKNNNELEVHKLVFESMITHKRAAKVFAH